MKKAIAILLCMLMSFAVLGCSNNDAPVEPSAPVESNTPAESQNPEQNNAAEPAQEGVNVAENSDIVVVTGSDMVTFYPINAANTLDGGIQKLMMDGLVGFDKDYKLIWMLATDCEANEDSTEYTFHLRQGISFQDGTPWNAEAAKVNLDIMANQELKYKKSSNYRMIDYTEVVDEYTIKVYLKYSFGAFINYLAHPSALMVSPTQLQNDPESVETGAIGTGQYSLVEWRPGEYWKLALNREWWGYDKEICGGEALVANNAGFNTITFKPISEAATRVAMLMAKEAEMGGASSTYVETLTGAGLTVEYQTTGLSLTYLYMNCQKELFKDVRVRKAINMAIDIDTMINVTEGGAAVRADSYITPAVSYYSSQAADLYKYDIETAKALLAEAGYPNGFEVTLWTMNNSSSVQRGEFIQQQLEQIGIKVNVVPCESGVLSSNVSGYSGDPAETGYDMYLRGFSPSTGDADQGLARFSTAMFMPAGSNYCLYSNTDYDALMEKGVATSNADERAAIYAEAQKLIWDECPCVPLFFTTDGYVYNPEKISNVCYYPDGSFYLRDGVYVG